MRVKRIGGKGGATRSNATNSQGKQKATGRWEVEVARQEAGVHQEDGASRGRGALRG